MGENNCSNLSTHTHVEPPALINMGPLIVDPDCEYVGHHNSQDPSSLTSECSQWAPLYQCSGSANHGFSHIEW